ncbi:4Fe-4S dicluster domain-containing protein [bacterium]|nr:4Fe-4S dicluster domain-containing protein [bacterium]
MKYEIHILEERCKGCGICVEICQADVLELSPEANEKGIQVPYPKKPENCLNCGMGEMFCPDFAIYVWVNDDEEEVRE